MHQLITRREIYRVELPPEVVCLCETELRSWLKPLGAWLVREKERVEAVNLSMEETERLLLFLRSVLGYTLFGELVRAVSGVTYEEYVHQHIIQPLGLKYTAPTLTPEIVDNLAAGYSRDIPGQERQPYAF
ncbi:hypothetical protein KSD_76400 [Ktedonobacter sp. SOSP1-85]|uniref:serine hydrolase n=1 Tax=Ktedonobacter sp. SOSP1-85 TaxID=2778367 RepID=UPI0019162082|nr:serine hydrolase domain-containing protein [Ktedonobacter sp. SOSP1-85]GHO79869.1 hypothetical protein KSD_76400 [Ktedonobacter sp. SOSP1-85]